MDSTSPSTRSTSAAPGDAPGNKAGGAAGGGPGPASAPGRWTFALGHAGLIPFVVGAVAVWALPDGGAAAAYAGLALSAYAAVIVSFLGGIHWGVALRQPAPPPALLAWGVVPSLAAWVALLLPLPAALAVHGAMLLLCWAVDRVVYPRHGLGRWLPLRLRLSAVAALSCFVGAAGAWGG